MKEHVIGFLAENVAEARTKVKGISLLGTIKSITAKGWFVDKAGDTWFCDTEATKITVHSIGVRNDTLLTTDENGKPARVRRVEKPMRFRITFEAEHGIWIED